WSARNCGGAPPRLAMRSITSSTTSNRSSLRLDATTTIAIYELWDAGHGKRATARILGPSRGGVRAVPAAGAPAVPPLARAEKAEAYHDAILAHFTRCKGNLVRVHEELVAEGADFSYQALTAYCRRHGIGEPPKAPAGQYPHEPGEE